MKCIDTQFVLQCLYFILFLVGFGLWHHFQNYTNFLVITFQWSPAVCSQLEAASKHSCLKTVDDSWVITDFKAHKSGGPRSYCDNRYPFIGSYIKADSRLLNNLEKIWPSMENGTESLDLWRHSYVKYGTCVTMKRHLHAELEYFRKADKLYSDAALQQALKKKNIEASTTKTYKVSEILEAVKEQTKTDAILQCFKSKAKPEKQKQQILAEIILCANPQANSFTDCSNVKSIKRRVTATKWDVMTSSPQQITNDLTDCSEELPCLLMT